jgi:Tfp pilus assembly protein PilX
VIHASKKNQHGAVLLMALMFLILLTLIGIAAVNSTSSGFKVVGNMQSRAYALSLAQAAIESVISSTTVFYTPATSTVLVDGQSITVTVPVCTGTSPAAGYELGGSGGVTPVDNHWAVGATYTDTITSASVAVRQGVKMRQTAGSC